MRIDARLEYVITVSSAELSLIGRALHGTMTERDAEQARDLNTDIIRRRRKIAVDQLEVIERLSKVVERSGNDNE